MQRVDHYEGVRAELRPDTALDRVMIALCLWPLEILVLSRMVVSLFSDFTHG